MSDRSRALYIPGRFQPPTNHHFRLLRHVSEMYTPDRIALGILPPRNRSGANPFTTEEVQQLVDDGLAERDIPVPVDTFVLDEHPLDHRSRMVERLGEPAAFYTRERRWAAVSWTLAAVDRSNGGPHDIATLYEPRDDTVLEPYGDAPYTGDATAVRERIARDGAWERYVPDAVAARIADDYTDGLEACRAAPDPASGKYDILHRGWTYLDDLLGSAGLP